MEKRRLIQLVGYEYDDPMSVASRVDWIQKDAWDS